MNGRVDVPVNDEVNVTLVPASVEVRVAVFVMELPTVWLVPANADTDALDDCVAVFALVLAMKGATVSVCDENDDPRVI